MPAQVLPSLKNLKEFEFELKKRGFRTILGVEVRAQLDKLAAQAPRFRPGRETGYIFYAHGLVVIVWTTWLPMESRARDKDAGWVLIVENGKVLYSSRPIHRTKNFLPNLFRHAWIARWRAIHRPRCPECNEFMKIAMGEGIKSRYWRCDVVYHHKSNRPINLGWDHDLPQRAKDYLAALRKSRAAYLEERRMAGKPSPVAIFKRKKWMRKRDRAPIV